MLLLGDFNHGLLTGGLDCGIRSLLDVPTRNSISSKLANSGDGGGLLKNVCGSAGPDRAAAGDDHRRFAHAAQLLEDSAGRPPA